MATTYEKGRTKQYSRVSYGMKAGGETKRSRKKSDEQLEMESANREEFSSDVRKRFKDIPGSLKDAGERIMRGLKPTIDEVVQSRPAMKSGGSVKKYSGGGESKAMMKKEVAFMKNKGAPKSMLKHEMAEMKGGKAKRYAEGGASRIDMSTPEKRERNMGMYRYEMSRKKAQKAQLGNSRRPKTKEMPNPKREDPRIEAYKRSISQTGKMPVMSKLSPQQRSQIMKMYMSKDKERYKAKSKKMPRPGRGDGPGFKSDKMPNPRPRPRPGRGDGPGFKSDKMPNPRPRPRPGRGMISNNTAGMIANKPKSSKSSHPFRSKANAMPMNRTGRPGTNPKTDQMPRPGTRPTPSRPTPPMAARRMAGAASAARKGLGPRGNMKAGGDVYTTPGGPARGKSGKIKKMAAGGMAGMIPKAGKKSPSSMGTSYKKGGAIDGCAVKGKTRGRIK